MECCFYCRSRTGFPIILCTFAEVKSNFDRSLHEVISLQTCLTRFATALV